MSALSSNRNSKRIHVSSPLDGTTAPATGAASPAGSSENGDADSPVVIYVDGTPKADRAPDSVRPAHLDATQETDRQLSCISLQCVVAGPDSGASPRTGEKEDGGTAVFVPSEGLSTAEAQELLRVWGPNRLPEKTVPKWYVFMSHLWQPMPLMIWAAAVIEAGIENWVDFAILIFIQLANASIGFYEITKAGDAVAALKKSLQPTAYAKRDGRFTALDAALLVPGDLILLAAGSAVPADCRTHVGKIKVDMAALTGESLPVTVNALEECRMGSNVVRGETEATVTATGANTFFGKTAALLGQSGEASNLQKLTVSVVSVLVGVSVVLCAIVFIYLCTLTDVPEALSLTVVLLVASIPMAIEIVTTTTLAVGSKELSKHGAIVTRLAAIEDLAGMSILCSDKTGTLTLNKMEIQEETPVYVEGESRHSLLRYGAMAAKWKEPPKDALDTLTLGAVDMASLETVEQLDYLPFDPTLKRTEGTVREHGKTFKTTKGAPHVILKLVQQHGPKPDLAARVERDICSFSSRGVRTLAVAKTDESGEWQFLGMLTFLDPPRPDTEETIDRAKEYGVAVKMITGDHLLIARETSRALGMGEFICSPADSVSRLPSIDPTDLKDAIARSDSILASFTDRERCLAADGFAQVYPEHKYQIVQSLRELGHKVGMLGDGVNDAPALKRADVGVAVQGATDAARSAAGIVLTQPGLSTIVDGIVIARRIFARISNFFVYRIAVTIQLLMFFFIALFWFKPLDFMPSDWQTMADFPDTQEWPAFFYMPVLLLMLITLLNDGTMVAIGYDNALASKNPCVWNKRALFTVSSALALPALISSLLLLWLMLHSWTPGSLFHSTGLGGLSYGQITTAIYLKVSISDFLTLFSARTGRGWFWSIPPSPLLAGAACIALAASTAIACAMPGSYPDGIYTLGLGYRTPYALAAYIWIYCLVWWVIQDACKVVLLRWMERYTVFGINAGETCQPQSAGQYMETHKGRYSATKLGQTHAKHPVTEQLDVTAAV